jgi:hypothetical protein
MKMSVVQENGHDYVERNLGCSRATTVGRTSERAADYTKDI